jgi:EmrB/QacA subfamily drug resistance transporter
MATIDASIVNISLPVLAHHFGQPLGGAIEWVVIAYLVVVAALLLTAGRLSDVFGKRTLWAAGLAFFTATSALCGAAPSLGFLVASRALQGVGAAAVMAVSPAMLVGAFPPAQRGRALGLNALVVGIGISLGPTLGGVIAQELGWRLIFYVNVPLGVVGVIASTLFLPRDRLAGARRIDVTGAALLAVGLGGLTATLSFGSDVGWTSPMQIGGDVITALAFIAFVRHVATVPEAIVDRRLFANRTFSVASVSLLLSFIATSGVPVLLPFYLLHVRGWSTARAGVLLTPLPLTVALTSPLSGALADRVGTRSLSAAGMFIASVGLALLTWIDDRTSVSRLVLILAIVGAGQAIFRPPNNSALMGSVGRDQQGAAAGVLATARVVGQSVGVAGTGALFASFAGSEVTRALKHAAFSPMARSTDSFLRGMHGAFAGCTVVAILAAAASLVRKPARD